MFHLWSTSEAQNRYQFPVEKKYKMRSRLNVPASQSKMAPNLKIIWHQSYTVNPAGKNYSNTSMRFFFTACFRRHMYIVYYDSNNNRSNNYKWAYLPLELCGVLRCCHVESHLAAVKIQIQEITLNHKNSKLWLR